MADATITLDDGRTLGYAEYGNPSGEVLVYHHGGLSCALDIAFADAWCREHGVRILAPDRPGIRESSPLPGYGLKQTARDTGALCDQLGIDRFPVAGWSAGGSHAITCAVVSGDRVTAVATIGCLAPKINRFLYPAAKHAPVVARSLIAIAARTPASIRERQIRRAVRCPADLRVLDALPAGTVAGWMDCATRRDPRGLLDDYLATGSDWTGTAGSATGPVHLFQGADDHVVPPDNAEKLAALIPQAELNLLENAGHFLLHEHLPEVTSALGLGYA